MNIYKLKFYAECPSDGEMIEYDWTIESDVMLKVELLKQSCRMIVSGYHENLADDLFKQYRKKQTIVAVHMGVEITTIRE